jgi:hypothetical protein
VKKARQAAKRTRARATKARRAKARAKPRAMAARVKQRTKARAQAPATQPARARRPVDGEAPHAESLTALAAEAWRSGVLPGRARSNRRRGVIPGEEGEKILVGDPDDDSLANEYVGDETPGGSAPTPDQNEVDEIGRAYGLQEEDTGSLRTAQEVLTRRDRHRIELKPPGRPRT